MNKDTMNLWCVFCVLIIIGISVLPLYGVPLQVKLIIGVVVAGIVFISPVLIKKFSSSSFSGRNYYICPVCKTKVDKKEGVCPNCGKKL